MIAVSFSHIISLFFVFLIVILCYYVIINFYKNYVIIIILFNYFFFFFMKITFIFHVPGCSGMFRVPGFIDARLVFTLYNVVRGLSFIFDPLSWGMVMYDNQFVL